MYYHPSSIYSQIRGPRASRCDWTAGHEFDRLVRRLAALESGPLGAGAGAQVRAGGGPEISGE